MGMREGLAIFIVVTWIVWIQSDGLDKGVIRPRSATIPPERLKPTHDSLRKAHAGCRDELVRFQRNYDPSHHAKPFVYKQNNCRGASLLYNMTGLYLGLVLVDGMAQVIRAEAPSPQNVHGTELMELY